jgi:hypothetical protein
MQSALTTMSARQNRNKPMNNVIPMPNAIIENGEVQSLDSIAAQVRSLLSRMEQDAWEIGRLVSVAREMCKKKDCGIEGDNPDARFGKWVSGNFPDTPQKTVHQKRIMVEKFGPDTIGREKHEAITKRIGQSSLYDLAAPKADSYREKVMNEVLRMPEPENGRPYPAKQISKIVSTEKEKATGSGVNSGAKEWILRTFGDQGWFTAEDAAERYDGEYPAHKDPKYMHDHPLAALRRKSRALKTGDLFEVEKCGSMTSELRFRYRITLASSISKTVDIEVLRKKLKPILKSMRTESKKNAATYSPGIVGQAVQDIERLLNELGT